MRRCKNWNSWNLLLKGSNYLKDCSASFSQSTECLIPDFHSEILSEALKVSSYSGHDCISWSFYPMVLRMSGEGNGNPLQYSCLENPMDGGAWQAAVHGVAKSQTWLRDFTFTFHFHALEKEMATHSSVLAWRIPGTGEPGGLPSVGSHSVGHDWSDLATENVHSQVWQRFCW